MKKLIFPLFVIMALAQWIVPGKMILDSERVLRDGDVYKFKTQPVDPSDPFRGKYITLNFEADHFETDTLQKFENGQEVYLKLSIDSLGFAGIAALEAERPENIEGVLITTISNTNPYRLPGRQYVYFEYPFERFYVEESKAAEAERAYWDSNRDSTHTTYALVKIKNGQAVLEDVRIDDKSIVDIVRAINERADKPKN